MKKAEKIILTSFLFLLSFVPFLWLSKGELILGYDAVFPLNPAAFLLDRIYSWTSTQGFTMDQSGIQGSLVIHFIDSIPYFFGFSASNAQKIVFSFWFFAMLFSSYIFIVRLEKSGFTESRYLRYFFPVFYTFNFYILQAWWAIERTKFSLVVATPLILSIILPMIKEKLSIWRILRYAVLCSLILTIFNGGGWVGFPLYGGLFVILGCYYLFFSLILLLNKKIRKWLLINVFFVFFSLCYMLFNAYTFLPFILTTINSYASIVASAGGISGLIEWSRYISENASFLNLFRLQGIPDWYNNGRFHPYSSYYLNNPVLIFSSFLIPLFVVLSFVNKHNKNKIIVPFFLLTLIVSAFFTAGAHPPLGFLFEFLMKTVPGFVGFRSAIFKFGYAYWFSVSFLISLLLSNVLVIIVGKIKNVRIANFTGIVLTITVVSFILLYHFPFLTGNIFRIDPTNVSARVSVPSYVFEFSKWWKENGRENKILLLPKLNDNWFFEQYNWNYMSLFPVTGNFASSGIIENAVILSEKELEAINDLYEAINTNKYEKVDFLLDILGIKYFLIRRDFYFDFPNQKTDDPFIVEEKLIGNPNIKKSATFGEWVVYEHLDSKSILTARTNPVFTSGKVASDELFVLGRDSILSLGDDGFDKYPETFSSIIISPDCLNCTIEREEIQVFFPRPRILVDSNLYQFVELRDKLKIKKNETIEAKINRLIGNTLRLTGQIDQLIEQDRDEYYIGVAKDKYIRVLDEILSDLQNIFIKSNNPYRNVILLQQYLIEEERHFNELISSKVDRERILVILEKALHAIQNLTDRLKTYYDDSNLNKEKVYRFNVVESGNYDIKINIESLGSLETQDAKFLSLSIDNQASLSGSIEASDVNFGTIFLGKGDHEIYLSVPPQKNIVSEVKHERVAGKNCYSSFINNFSHKKVYILKFTSRNNFDPGFFFFVDHGKTFSPIIVNYIPLLGEQVKSNGIIISSQRMKLDKTTDKLRISFCALSLTEDLYKENIRNLSFVELNSPILSITHQMGNNFNDAPKVSFKKLNQTHFITSIKEASAPFYIVLSDKYALGWEASIGVHLIGNKFQNVWYVDKKGSYDMDILYKPQKYVSIGFVASIVSLVLAVSVLFWKRKKNI